MKYAHTGKKLSMDACIVGMMLYRRTDHDQQTGTGEIEKTDLNTEKSGALVAHTVEHFSVKEKWMHVRDFRRIRCTGQCNSMHWYRWKDVYDWKTQKVLDALRKYIAMLLPVRLMQYAN